MNNITIGQYIPGDSWMHRLDPRIKLFSMIVLLVAIFIIPISSDPVPILSMLGLFFGIGLLTISTRVPLKKVLNGLRPIVFLLTFTFFIQILYVRTGTLVVDPIEMYLSLTSVLAIIALIVFYNWSKKYVPLRVIYFFSTAVAIFALQALLPYVPFTSYTLRIYDQGLLRAGFIFVRIINVIVLTSLLTFTTMTTDLNYGVESLLRPFKRIGLPVDVIAMMLSLTLRYIPTLLGETEKIMKAQASRGVDFKESKLKEKIVQVISLLIPVFVISFKRAEDLGNAMEVRGYVIGRPRTRIDAYHIGISDYVVLVLSFVVLATIIAIKGLL